MSYKPPFSISTRAINLIAEISAQVERFAIMMEKEDGLLLRKINRIKTIQGSLAIEGNNLSESDITEIIEGKTVVAPMREIQEVKNAIRTYDAYNSLNPYLVKDMLKAHGLMMEALADDAGHFRQKEVGVFAGKKPIHLAPPAKRVPLLMEDLFDWLINSEDHLLIKSCVFHYEFEFIHPFSDGNGRIGRLWQSLILGKLHPIFEHLPVENMVFANQQAYYEAINQSTKNTNSGIFVDFMLGEILATLKKKQGKKLKEVNNVGVNAGVNVGVKEQKVLEILRNNPKITVKEIAENLTISGRQAERLFSSLKKKGLIIRIGADKTGYWMVKI